MPVLTGSANQGTLADYHGVPPVPVYHKGKIHQSYKYDPYPGPAGPPPVVFGSAYSYGRAEMTEHPSMFSQPGSAMMTPQTEMEGEIAGAL